MTIHIQSIYNLYINLYTCIIHIYVYIYSHLFWAYLKVEPMNYWYAYVKNSQFFQSFPNGCTKLHSQ